VSCPDCEIDYRETMRLAYGPMPPDGVLLTGKQIQRFARRVIDDALKIPTLIGERDGTPRGN
jgi:hypothetical protein